MNQNIANAAANQNNSTEKMQQELHGDSKESTQKIRDFLWRAETESVDELLQELGTLYRADRAYVFEDDPSKGITCNTYEWCAEGMIPEIDNLKEVSLEGMQEIENVVRKGELVIHSIEDELNPDEPLYQLLAPQQIHSIILVPLLFGGKMAGYIGVDNPQENTDLSLILLAVSSIISSKVLYQRHLAENDESFTVLRKLREQYATMYYVDFETDYMHTYKTNDSYEDKYGVTTHYSESMGAYVCNDIGEKDRERMLQQTHPSYVMNRFQNEESFVLDFEDTSFGEIRYCQLRYIKANESGTHAVVCGEDVTKEKLEERNRTRALEEMQDIISASRMGTWSIELIEGEEPRMRADDRMKDILGIAGQEMTQEETYAFWFSRIKPEAVQSVLDSVEKMEQAGRDENTYLWVHPLLGERYVRCGGTSRKVEGGYILRGYHYDADELVREQEKQAGLLKDALLAAEHANHAKTAFLNNMSHDIRTPMNAIIGYTALAASHIDNKERVQDYLSKITVSSSHLLSLINDVLDMSRIESGKVTIDEKEVHLPDILHDIRTITQANISAKQLDFYIDSVDVVHEDIICDKLRLEQLMLNIISNATKFTKPGGSVSVRIMEKPCRMAGYAHYEFRVKDTGIGMSEDFQEHIFEPFTREQTATVSGIQGTGLGMAICKNIVDMMGGTIAVKSKVGVGSEFIVGVDFGINGKAARYEPVPQLQGIRALVADDDSDTAISVSNMLKSIGLRSDWTLSGKEAVLRAKVAVQEADEYGVYIIDWLMPDMNGIETVRQIRRHIGEDVPFIILTAYDWSDIEEEAKAAGVTGFVSKPIFMSELRDILSRPFRRKSEEGEEIGAAGNQKDSAKGTADGACGGGAKEEHTLQEQMQALSGKHILLAEDNKLNQEIAIEILAQYGITTDVAEDGSQAVEAVRNGAPGRYDLILMDIQMPKMDGYAATRQIRSLENPALAQIPIIAMTANAFEEDRKLALEAGMDGYVTKPIDIHEVLEAICKAV